MIEVFDISDHEVNVILSMQEGHFFDFKSKGYAPSKLTKHLSAFANADGGDVIVGVEDKSRAWSGFTNQEEANGLIQTLESFSQFGNDLQYCFLKNSNQAGLLLKIELRKSREIKKSTSGQVYLRRGAQSLPVDGEAALDQLRRNKGISSLESETVNIPLESVTRGAGV